MGILKCKQCFYGFAETIAEYNPDNITYPNTNYKTKTSTPAMVYTLLDDGKYYRAHRKYQQ